MSFVEDVAKTSKNQNKNKNKNKKTNPYIIQVDVIKSTRNQLKVEEGSCHGFLPGPPYLSKLMDPAV